MTLAFKKLAARASEASETSKRSKIKARTPQEINTDIDSPGHPFFMGLAKHTFSADSRKKMYERLASPIEAGIPMKTAISQLYQRAAFKSETETQAIVLRFALYTLNNGGQLSEGLGKFVPLNEILLIRAGEEKGELSTALFRAAHTIEAQSKVKAAITSAIAKPAILFIVLLIAMWVIGAHVAPQMSAILPMDEWRGQAAFLGLISSIVTSIWFFIILAILAGIYTVISLSKKRWTGKGRAFADKLPPYSLFRVMQGAGWLTTYSSMLQSGRRVESILMELIQLSEKDKNAYLADRTRRILSENAHGAENIGIAMERSKTSFPDNDLIADMVMQASLSNFDERIGILADRWINDAVTRVQRIAAVMNVATILLLAVFMANFVMGVIALNQQISSSLGTF